MILPSANLPACERHPAQKTIGPWLHWRPGPGEASIQTPLSSDHTGESKDVGEEAETRPEEALTQGTTIRGVRDLEGFWRTGRGLPPCPAEQVPGDNSSVAGETRSGVKEQIISKETSLLSQN